MSTPTFSLNPDTWELIIDELASDSHSLQCLGRTCKSFVPRTRHHLFRSVRIDKEKRIPEFIRIISPYVWQVHVNGPVGDSEGKENDILPYEFTELRELYLLSHDFRGADFGSSDAPSILVERFHPAVLSNVTFLRLEDGWFSTDRQLVELVAGFPKLHSFIFRGGFCPLDETIFSAPVPPPPSGLKVVEIESIWTILGWIRGSTVQLEELRIHWLDWSGLLLEVDQLGLYLMYEGHTVKKLTLACELPSREYPVFKFSNGISPEIPSLSTAVINDIDIGLSKILSKATSNRDLPSLIWRLREATTNKKGGPLDLIINIEVIGPIELGSADSHEFDWDELAGALGDGVRAKFVLTPNISERAPLDEKGLEAWQKGMELYVCERLGPVTVEMRPLCLYTPDIDI